MSTAYFRFFLEAARTRCRRLFLASKKRVRWTGKLPAICFAQRKISNNDQHLPEPLRLAGARSRVLQWGCSLWDYLQGFRGLLSTSPDPTNQLPSSHLGQATRPPGGSTAHFDLSESSTHYPVLQPNVNLSVNAWLQLHEDSNSSARTQPTQSCGKACFPVGNRRNLLLA